MTKVMEKLSVIWVIWGLMQVAYHLFITRNIPMEIIWMILTCLFTLNWGLWSDDS